MLTTFTFRLLLELICSVLIADIALTSAAILSAPKDTVALVGARVELECRTNNLTVPLRWSYYASNDPQRLVALFDGRAVSNASASTYEVRAINGSGQYNLIIKSAAFSSAGIYICAEDSRVQNATEAFLTVLASDPVCAANANPVINGTVENDELWAWCMVIYTSSGNPVMNWNNSRGPRITYKFAKTDTFHGVAKNYTEGIKLQPKYTDNRKMISCKIVFERPHPKETPNYAYIWNYTANVLYGPKKLKITPPSGTFAVSERLSCSADGNPPPTFEWTDIETGRVVTREHTFTLEENITSNKEYTYKCTAVNVVAGQNKYASNKITFNVAASSANLLVSALVPSTVALILGSIVGILLALRARRNATESHRSFNDNLEDSNAASQPTPRLEIEAHPHSDVFVNAADEYVEPDERLYTGLTARPDCVEGNQGNVETYTRLHHLNRNTSGSNENADYLEII